MYFFQFSGFLIRDYVDIQIFYIQFPSDNLI